MEAETKQKVERKDLVCSGKEGLCDLLESGLGEELERFHQVVCFRAVKGTGEHKKSEDLQAAYLLPGLRGSVIFFKISKMPP